MSENPSYQEVVQRLQDLPDAIMHGYLILAGTFAVAMLITVWSHYKKKEKER